MHRKILVCVFSQFFTFISCTQIAVAQEKWKETQLYYSGFPQSSAEQNLLLGVEIGKRKAEIATTLIRRLGGPFSQAYFTSSKAELLNSKNAMLSGYLVRREMLRFPVKLDKWWYSGTFFLSVEKQRWPDLVAFSAMQWGPGHHRTPRAQAFAFTVEINPGQILRRRKRVW